MNSFPFFSRNVIIILVIRMLELDRLKQLIGAENIQKLKQKTVLILGLGGVGGYAVEALVRSGIGHVILIDYDTVEMTNLNRQIIAAKSTIGKQKVDIWKQRIKDISNTEVTVKKIRVTEENIDSIFEEKIDYAIDACDTISVKFAFLKICIKHNIPFVTCLGTGKRLDPTKVEHTELMKTSGDPIAKILRKKVKSEKIKQKIPVIYSKEIPKKTESKSIPSSIFVPSSAGILAASLAFQTLLEGE